MGRYNEDDGWGFVGQIFAIALGVFIGALGALQTWESITLWRLERAAGVAMKEVQQNLQQMRLADQRRAADLERVRQSARDTEAAQLDAQAAADHQRRESAARKELAWQQFYRPSQACVHDSANILCANTYMAAKKVFEARYRD